MQSFLGQNILSVAQFDRAAVEQVLFYAEKMAPYVNREKRTSVLNGAILGNLFFEPSTRTRVSFGSAFNLLGGSVRETTGMSSSALAKGESLFDTAKVMSGYCDVIAMRHPEPGSVAEFATGSAVPVVNGGDGANEHPTQALLDLYTIAAERRQFGQGIDNLHICMLGDLKHGRTVHSLAKLLCLFNNITFSLISPAELAMPSEVVDIIENAGHKVVVNEQLSEPVSADVCYQTRVQEERFASQQTADLYRGKFRLDQQVYTQFFTPNTTIMHPLPRDSRPEANELDNDLNQHPNLAIFRQTLNGVKVRMALFALALGVENKISDYEQSVHWFSPNNR